ncbi:GNAT family N-acetyltransferase [Aeromonas veronii]|uniref:GNAT family N-acetyltransferase n=1 Tax=Aeromonas veronii TaxID=654 RepID=UPI001961AEB0|nr:GNAT family N-acetyltransferase [Aeromonas veronii]ELV7510515.1 GNAT family N-acetyltransferase [Aeromonas veronii]
MIAIRKASKSDAQCIYELRTRAILDKCAQNYSERQLSLWTQGGLSEGFVEDVVTNFYVSEVNGRVIGSGKINTQTGMIDTIFVDPDYFGLGAAKKMLAHLEALAQENGLQF